MMLLEQQCLHHGPKVSARRMAQLLSIVPPMVKSHLFRLSRAPARLERLLAHH